MNPKLESWQIALLERKVEQALSNEIIIERNKIRKTVEIVLRQLELVLAKC